MLHDFAIGGHSSFFRTYKRVAVLVNWEGMRKSIQDYVHACEVRQRNMYQTLSPGGFYSHCQYQNKCVTIFPRTLLVDYLKLWVYILSL